MGLSDLASKDFARYSKYLAAVGSLTELFSDNDRPLINSRTAERLFVFLTGARDLSRKDNSFDAFIGDVGVGIKTFTASSIRASSLQKVAEFSNAADRNQLMGLSPKSLAREVSLRRNLRVSSHAVQYGISTDRSYYHCVVRIPGGIVVHETPLRLIQVGDIKPINARGEVQKNWPKSVKQNASVMFTDGLHNYSFHPGKSVLMMKFDLGEGSLTDLIRVEPIPNVFNFLLKKIPSTKSWKSDASGFRVMSSRLSEVENSVLDSILLPLYSPKSGQVPLKSGLNQWLAGGRRRSFGEAYISIPASVHALAPGFLPPRDRFFQLVLPNDEKVSVKVCQEGGKALMSNPNSDLGAWLMVALDGSLSDARKRFERGSAYSRADLERLGSDCMRITRTDSPSVYRASFAELGEFESFIENSELEALK